MMKKSINTQQQEQKTPGWTLQTRAKAKARASSATRVEAKATRQDFARVLARQLAKVQEERVKERPKEKVTRKGMAKEVPKEERRARGKDTKATASTADSWDTRRIVS